MLTHGLIGAQEKAELSELLRTGRTNSEVALWLSRAYPDIIETMELETGDTADYRTISYPTRRWKTSRNSSARL